MLIFTRNPLVTAVAASKPNQIHQNKDKEMFSSNSGCNNRAIVAISIVQQPAPAKKPTILKNLLKKSASVPSSSLSAKENKKKPLPGSSSVESTADTALKRIQFGQRQFEVAEVQKQRKEQLVKKLKEQEDKQMKFNFHANPAPKYKKVVLAHKQNSEVGRKMLVKQSSLPQICISKKVSKENVVVPSCGDPERLKYLNEKKKMLLAKYQETHVQFKAKPAAVLKKQPFQPVHNNVKVVDHKPFKLQLTERLLMRSEFDKKLLETISIRKKQEEVRKRQQDSDDRKLLRQKTEFRARANPFRNH